MQMFFGMIRQSCGGSDHPTANQFLYAYRLLSAKSLVRPPRGASVESSVPVEILGTLKADKSQSAGKASVDVVEQRIESLLMQDADDVEADIDMDLMLEVDNIEAEGQPAECIMMYLGGYVAHKLQRFSSCIDCMQLLSCRHTTDTLESISDAKLIQLKSWGALKLPSTALMKLLQLLECYVQKSSANLCADVYWNILNDVLAADDLAVSTIGCSAHATALTSRCIHFYIVARLFFIRKACNRNRASTQKKHKLSKLSKLT